MIAERYFADTNLFLRYLTNDVPKQADVIEQFFRRAASGEIGLVTNSLVIAEIVWTLESFYHLARAEIQSSVLAILSTPGLEVAGGTSILRAMRWYLDKNIDFIDAYNAAWLLDEGLDKIFTFDREHFTRLEGLRVLVLGEEL